jgi:hypothetical protein
MNAVSQAIEELLGRASGPMHLRLVMQPLMAAILAIKAGKRDAKAGAPPYLWSIFTSPEERAILLRSGWKDFSKAFVIAFVIDTVYQLVALKSFHPLQGVIVAIALCAVPYLLLRGPASRLFGRSGS